MNKIFERLAPPLVVVLLMILLGSNLLRSVDFGHHWDEKLMIESVAEAREKGKWTADWYNYPSATFLLARFAHDNRWVDSLVPKFSQRTLSEQWLLRTRIWFIFFGLLLVPGIYLFGKEMSNPAGGLFAAGTAAFGFELNYHMRWVAPDILVTVFIAYAAWALAAAIRRDKTHWWLLASVFAGMAFASKYPAGIMIGVVGLAFLLKRFREYKKPINWAIFLGIPALFLIVFVIITPGFITDTAQFFKDIAFEAEHYREGHRAHTVDGFWDHFKKLFEYLVKVVGSHSTWISIGMFALSLGGFVYVFYKHRIRSLVLLFPLIYLLFFSFQNVMIVRNYLPAVPFLAAGAGLGFVAILDFVRDLKIKNFSFPDLYRTVAISSLAVLFLVPNYLDSREAVDSIRDRKNFIRFGGELVEYMQDNPKQNFLLSDRLYVYMMHNFRPLPPNAGARIADFPPEDYLVVFPNIDPEQDFRNHFHANDVDYVLRDFGPRAVNHSYYPDWMERAILVMKPKYSKNIPLEFR